MIAPPGYSYEVNADTREIEVRYRGEIEAFLPLRRGALAEVEELRELRRYFAYEWMKVNLPQHGWRVEEVGSSCVIAFGFTGEYTDHTGLLHLRARQYDPALGRFLSTDPVAPPLADPYIGAYVYVRNNPTVLMDPSGLCPFCVLGAIGAAVGGVVGGATYAVTAR